MTQRISYVPLDDMTPDMRAEMERCAREGTPRPESTAVRAHVWLRMLDIEHHAVPAGSDASMAPGYETAEAVRARKAADDYWAKT